MKKHVPIMLGAMCMLQILAGNPASAQERVGFETSSYAVSHGDLDLNSQAGAAAMLGRLQNAAERACGYDRGDRNLRNQRYARACTDVAMRDAVAAANLDVQYASWRNGDVSQPAAAVQIAENGMRARVSFGDLNLNTNNGRAALQSRIARATNAICGDRSIGRISASQRRCAQDAASQARVQVAAITEQRQTAALVSTAPQAASEPAATATTQPAALTQTASTSYGVCDARALDARFEGQSGALGAHARREVGYAVDGASVCRLERAVIVADRNSALAQRRANTLRSALIARGVPANMVVVEHVDDTSALGSRVQMSFSGVALSDDAAEVHTAAAGV